MTLALWAIALAIVFLALKGMTMSAAMDRLASEVAEMTSVAQSAVALIADIAQQMRDNAEDADAINALADDLDAAGNSLGGAVAANTQAADEPAPEPTGEEPTGEEPTGEEPTV